MHDGSPGEIQGPQLAQPAATPDPMRYRAVDQQGPKDTEPQQRAELHPFGEGPGD